MLYALVSDLFFADRILRIAQNADEPVKTFTAVSMLQEALAAGDVPQMVLVELPMVDPQDLAWLKDVRHVAGYGPHVDRERFQAARAQGISPLWANSVLTQKLGPWIASCRLS